MARQIFFGFKRCHAAQAGSGDRLAVDVVGHVAGGVDALDIRAVESGAVQR
jgi:hypothetical protein